MNTLRKMVHQIAPKAEEVISYQMPAFKIVAKFHLIYYCVFAKYLSISSPWNEAMLKEFEELKVSKSVIQLPLDKELPTGLIERILKSRKAEFEQKIKK